MNYDIAIIGNGLAANLFARHLLLTDPNLKIAIVGPKDTPKYTVGESVTELASHYLQHRLKLSSYLFRNQLHKNGLRFFYDNEQKNLDITEMSEEGTVSFLRFNTFHLDRYIIEKDIKIINSKQGVCHINASASDVVFSDDGNSVIIKGDGKNKIVKTKWVIDASGMKRFLANKLGLKKEIKNNYHCAAWGHFNAINNIEDVSDEWARRNLFITREFSTIHFTYPNYWIWVIPLRDNVISCGVVYDGRYLFKNSPPDENRFLSYLKSHKALNGLFEKDKLLNFKTANNYSYSSNKFMSLEKRFVLLGDAGGFIDPLYSNGLDMLAQESDFFVDIIYKDLKDTKSKAELLELVEKVNALIDRSYEYYATLILGKYSCLGSCEIFSLKYFFEFFSYYLNRVWPFVSKQTVTDLYTQNNDIKFIFDIITHNFLILADEYKKQNLFYRKNSRWKQYSRRGIHIEEMMHLYLDKNMSKLRYFVLIELFKFVLLAQTELFLKRKDLLCDSKIADDITFENMIKNLSKSIIENDNFFKQMKYNIQKNEVSSSLTEFWYKWLKKVFCSNHTKHSGTNFSKLRIGLPYMDILPSNAREYPDEGVGNIVKIFHKAEEEKEFDSAKFDDYIMPFSIEAAAVCLIKRGSTMKNIVDVLSRKWGKQYIQLVVTGCGFGSYGIDPDKVLTDFNFTKEQIEWFIDGYGCKMGLEKFFNNKDIHFPSYPQRKPIVRGLGRCVTFIPNEENTKDKYQKYFEFFELYPEDKEDYYFGVGFSLVFTKTPHKLEGFLKSYEEQFKGDELYLIKKGIMEAISLRIKLQPDLYLPSLITFRLQKKAYPNYKKLKSSSFGLHRAKVLVR